MTTAQQSMQIELAEDDDEAPKPKKKKFKNVEVVHEGSQIILPVGMDEDEGIKWLLRKKEEMEREVAIYEEIYAYPFDGAYAFAKALKDVYGFTSLVPTPGFFGDDPPMMVGLEIDVNTTVQVPWGSMATPDIAGRLQTDIGKKNNLPILIIRGQVKQKDKDKVSKLVNLARQYVLRESVYRGRAVRIRFQDLRHEKFDPLQSPKFLDLSRVKEDELVFSDDVNAQVVTSLFTPIERTQLCRDHKVPLKRGVLLAGPYGVGKTLAAYVAASKAERHKWTFIYLDGVKQLEQAITFATAYQPAIIFAEDIDQVLGDEDRDEAENAILNTIDGVTSKDSEIIVCLTTNHVERVTQAMLRPGRLDAVIQVRPPDAAAVERLIRLYGRDLIAPHVQLGKIGELLKDRQPAVIREVVERSKLAAISHLAPGQQLMLDSRDLEIAARSMLDHLKLLEPKPDDSRSELVKAAEIIASAQKPQNGKGGAVVEMPNTRTPA